MTTNATRRRSIGRINHVTPIVDYEQQLSTRTAYMGGDYASMLEGNPVALYIPDNASYGDTVTLEDVSGNARHATAVSYGTIGTGWLNSKQAIRQSVEGDGIVGPAGLVSNINSNLFAYAVWARLPTYSATSYLVYGFAGSVNIYVRHLSANTIRFGISGAGGFCDLSNVPENEDIFLLFTYSINTYQQDAYVFHRAGVIKTSFITTAITQTPQTYLNIGATTAPANSFLGDIGPVGFYNTVLDQTWGQNVYDQMRGLTYGSNLVDVGAGTFESGTYSWVPYGSNTIANVNKSLQITYVNTASGAYNYFRNASDLSADLTPGQLYELSATVSVNTGGCYLTVYNGKGDESSLPITVDETTVTKRFVAYSSTSALFRPTSMVSGQIVTIHRWSLKAVTFSAAPQVLPILNELGEDSGSDASGTITATTNIYSTGLSDYHIRVILNSVAVTGNTNLYARYTDNNNYIQTIFSTGSSISVYSRIAGSLSSTLITTTYTTGDIIDIYFKGSSITLKKNNTLIGSTTVTSFAFNTKWYFQITGTHSLTYYLYDLYGRALNQSSTNTSQDANVNRFLSQLRAKWYDGTLTGSTVDNRSGNSTYDLTREATTRRKSTGEIVFASPTTALSKPYQAEDKTKPVTRLFLSRVFGAPVVGCFVNDNSDDRLVISGSLKVAGTSDYVTTDANASVNGTPVYGLNQLVGQTLDDSTDTIDLFAEQKQLTLSIDTTGVGGQNISTNNLIIGNITISSGANGFYGLMSLVIFLPATFMQADLYNRLLRQLVTLVYRQANKAQHTNVITLIPNANGTFDNIGHTSIAVDLTAGLALGTTPDKTGALPIDFNGSTGRWSFNLTTFTSEFDPNEGSIKIRTAFDNVTAPAGEYLFRFTAGSNYILAYRNTASSTLIIQRGVGASIATLTFTIPDTLEHEYELVYSVSESSVILYVDGVFSTSSTTCITFSGTFTIAAIGGSAQSSASAPLDGKIMEFSHTPAKVLSAIEAMQSYNLHTANGADAYAYALTTYAAYLIALLPVDAASGTTARNLVSGGASFTYSNITTYRAERAPFGGYSVEFGGTNSVIYKSLGDVIDGDEGSFSIWFNPDNWADGSERYFTLIYADGNNNIGIRKLATSNNFYARRTANASTDIIQISSTYSGWNKLDVTWSLSNNLFVAYINGISIGSDTGLVAWTGGATPAVYIGAASSGGGSSFDGKLSKPELLAGYAKSAAEVLADYEREVGTLIT